LPCPLGCGREGLLPGDLVKHVRGECPHRTVPCVSCGAAVKSKDLEKHLRSDCAEIARERGHFGANTHVQRSGLRFISAHTPVVTSPSSPSRYPFHGHTAQGWEPTHTISDLNAAKMMLENLRTPSPPAPLEGYLGGLGTIPTGQRMKDEAMQAYIKSMVLETSSTPSSSINVCKCQQVMERPQLQQEIRPSVESIPGHVWVVPSSELRMQGTPQYPTGEIKMVEASGMGMSPTNHTLQGEIRSLRSALVRTETENRRLAEEMRSMKDEFREMSTKTVVSENRVEDEKPYVMDKAETEQKIGEYVEKVFGSSLSPPVVRPKESVPLVTPKPVTQSPVVIAKHKLMERPYEEPVRLPFEEPVQLHASGTASEEQTANSDSDSDESVSKFLGALDTTPIEQEEEDSTW